MVSTSDLAHYISTIKALRNPGRQIIAMQFYNSRDTSFGGIFEPWGMLFDIPAKATIDIVAYGPVGDWLPREGLSIVLRVDYVGIWQERAIEGIGIFHNGSFLPNLKSYAGVDC